MADTPPFLRHEKTGQVFVYTPILAKRADMKAHYEAPPVAKPTAAQEQSAAANEVVALRQKLGEAEATIALQKREIEKLTRMVQSKPAAPVVPAPVAPTAAVVAPASTAVSAPSTGSSADGKRSRTRATRGPLAAPAPTPAPPPVPSAHDDDDLTAALAEMAEE